MIASDYGVFTATVRRAAGQEGPEAIATLRRALSLVRGRPFEWLSGKYEARAHDLVATRTAEDIVDAAHRMATLCLADGDPEGARWAAQQGLLASPGNEQLFRDRMVAEDLAGNPAVSDEFASLVDDEDLYGGGGQGGAW
ncbi:MAG TPA: bacterial transcriptional activator domain-containing protein [Acidimicrobiales bacterium]|nr:bacterial transcriptional activator domain-containing protein [Acidimicrobiales bacterium]